MRAEADLSPVPSHRPDHFAARALAPLRDVVDQGFCDDNGECEGPRFSRLGGAVDRALDSESAAERVEVAHLQGEGFPWPQSHSGHQIDQGDVATGPRVAIESSQEAGELLVVEVPLGLLGG